MLAIRGKVWRIAAYGDVFEGTDDRVHVAIGGMGDVNVKLDATGGAGESNR